jgi:hypothetical protein
MLCQWTNYVLPSNAPKPYYWYKLVTQFWSKHVMYFFLPRILFTYLLRNESLLISINFQSIILRGTQISIISSKYERSGNNNNNNTLSKLTKYVRHHFHRKTEDPLSLKVVRNSEHLQLLSNTVLSGHLKSLTCWKHVKGCEEEESISRMRPSYPAAEVLFEGRVYIQAEGPVSFANFIGDSFPFSVFSRGCKFSAGRLHQEVRNFIHFTLASL